jgi:SAM-dependent methyltransferase
MNKSIFFPSRRAAPEGPAHKRAPRPDELRHWLHGQLSGGADDRAMLAIGCEQVFASVQLLGYSSNVTVLDTSAGQTAMLARRFFEASFQLHRPGEPLPFPRGAFDVVWCNELLDRVFDPAACLREIRRVLAPGGRLLVTVADHGAVAGMLGRLLPRHGSAAANPRMRLFTPRNLTRAVADAGFTAVRVVRARVARSADEDAPPRCLLLSAEKDARVETAESTRVRGRRAPAMFTDELAFASRSTAR